MELISASPTREQIDAQFKRIMSSSRFRSAPLLLCILDIIRKECLKDAGVNLSSKLIGIELGEMPVDDDPDRTHEGYPKARSNLNHIRKRLNAFYETEGYSDIVRIKLERGSSVPAINLNPVFSKVPPLEPEAESLILRAKAALDFRSIRSLLRGFDYMQGLVELPTRHPRALSNALLLQYVASVILPSALLEISDVDEEAIRMIRKAGIALTPEGFEPWECTFVDACIVASRYHRWQEAFDLFDTSVLNSQGEARFYWWYTALIASTGRMADAIAILDGAYRLYGRTNVAIRTDLAALLIMSKRFAEAEEILSGTLDFVPAHNPVLTFHFCLLYEAQEKLAEAAAMVVQYMTYAMRQFQQHPGRPLDTRVDLHMMLLGMCSFVAGRGGGLQIADWTLELLLKYKETSPHVSSVDLAFAFIGHGRLDEAVAALERAAFEEGDPYSMWFHILPPLRHLEQHKGYRALLAKLRLPWHLYR